MQLVSRIPLVTVTVVVGTVVASISISLLFSVYWFQVIRDTRTKMLLY